MTVELLSPGLDILRKDSKYCSNLKSKFHEKSLRIMYNEKRSDFAEWLKQYRSVFIHSQNLQVLATEMFKVFNGTSPMTFSKMFHHKATSRFNLRQDPRFTIPLVDPVYSGTESNSYLFKN